MWQTWVYVNLGRHPIVLVDLLKHKTTVPHWVQSADLEVGLWLANVCGKGDRECQGACLVRLVLGCHTSQ